ncbi:MAG: Hsp20/alpha crystallin family protein, partial [Methylobacter sp.]
MKTKEQDTKKSSELVPGSLAGGMISFDKFDSFFEDFLSLRWPRLLESNFPIDMERGFPKVDIIDHDNEIEVQAALPGIKK